MVNISIKGINQEDIEIIDKAATKTGRSRSKFMVVSSLDVAKKVLEE